MATVKAQLSKIVKGIGGELPSPHLNHDPTSEIKQLAYYKAEARGFETGHEIDDWLEAEKELLGSSLPE